MEFDRPPTLYPAIRRHPLVLAIAGLGIATSLALPAQAQDFTFDEPSRRQVSAPVRAIAVGDVNGDRLDDLVTLASAPEPQTEPQLLVYLQRPDGTLAIPFETFAGEDATAFSLGIGDFNEDGINDIAVGLGDGISMLLADGSGSFLARPYSDGEISTVAQIADVDADGHLDILSVGTTGVSVILGDGHGNFRARTRLSGVGSPKALAYGDVSGDGHGDVVALSSRSFSVAKGDGRGNFLPGIGYDAPPESSDGALAIGDFDGDTRNELAIAEYSTFTDFQAVRIYSQDAGGNLMAPAYLKRVPFGAIAAMSRDFDQDGRDDLLVAFTPELGLYLQRATGLPAQPALFDLGSVLLGFASGDLDDDGCTDVAVAGHYDVSMLRGLNCVARDVASDFDGDGVSDLLWHNTISGESSIWKSADSSTQQSVVRVTDTSWVIVGTGDFDGDGRSDIVWRHRLTGAGTIWKSGDYRTQQALIRITDPDWNVAGVGDFDGDGKDDLLWRHAQSGRNAIWKSGAYHTQQAITGVTDVRWQVAGIGDFDGDGKDDIVWRHDASGANVIWKAGNYHTQERVTAVTNTDWQVAGVGDFDGDGIDDLFWRHARGANTIWRSADHARQLPVLKQPTRWSLAAVADYDGNGKADVIWRNGLDGSNAIWYSAAVEVSRDIAPVPEQSWVIAPQP